MVVYQSMLSDDKRLAMQAAMYRLNTKGKHRGYAQKVEVEQLERVQLQTVVEIVDAPDTSNDPPTPGAT
jgi:hypothetical protein